MNDSQYQIDPDKIIHEINEKGFSKLPSIKDFVDLVTDFADKPKINLKLNPTFLLPFAYLNEFFHRFFINSTPSLTVDGLNMSKKKMFFSSSKAKKKLRYRPRSVKNAIKDSVEWFNK